MRTGRSTVAFVSLVVGLVGGGACWLTRASLDVFVDPLRGPTRVVLLPSVAELLWLVPIAGGLAALVIVCLDRVEAPAGIDAGRPPLARALGPFLPLGVLVLLVLPFLPWLPDRLPAVQLLAGPARLLLWFVVLGQVAWLILARVWAHTRWTRPTPRAPGEGPTPGGSGVAWNAAVFVAGFAIIGGTGLSRIDSPIFPGGDEPHYLVMAQSLWLDGDLKIENNHERGDYAEYFGTDLRPHYLTRGVDGEIYSIHPIGLPLLIAPVYGLGGYPLVVVFLAAIGAAAAWLMWRWARSLTGSTAAASFAWGAVCLSVPFLFNGFSVYPEVTAALCVMLALLPASDEAHATPWDATRRALAIAALPWLSTKYAPMAAALVLVAAWRLWRRPETASGSRSRWALALGVTLSVPLLSVVGWLLFFQVFWGSPAPSAPYGGDAQTRLSHALVGAPGLWLDQEYGILLYAPVLVLGLTGLASMWRRGDAAARAAAVEIALVGTALLLTVGAFRIWWGGSAAPGRPVTSGLLLLGLPVVWRYAHAERPFRRSWYRMLLLFGLAVTAAVVFAERGFLMTNGRDGAATLLEWLSPNWHVWALLPSFIYHGPATAAGLALVWLAVAGLVVLLAERLGPGLASAWAAWHPREGHPAGLPALAATFGACVVVLGVSVVTPWLGGDRLQAGVDLVARARVPLLDDFDVAARPTAVVYDPLRQTPVTEVPPLFTFTASPELSRAPQGIPLLHDGRFGLPAGAYLIELTWLPPASEGQRPPRVDGTLELQLTRYSPPAQAWQVPLSDATSWRRTIALPVDLDFVGFRATRELEAMSPTLTMQPITIVDRRARPKVDRVTSVSTYQGVSVFAHDADVWTETAGFWVLGGVTTSVTLLAPGPGSVLLRYHCGPQHNRVRLTAGAWHDERDVPPDTWHEAALPPSEGGVTELSVSTAGGFSPSDRDASSDDKRYLGCWFEVGEGG